MTVANNYAPVVTAANGVTTVFGGSWNAISASYLVVQLLNTTTGVYTPVSQGPGANQYQVTTLTSSGFTITFNTAPASGYNVVISRSTTPQQTIPYTTSRGFQGSVEEGSFDQLTNMVQELIYEFGNAIQAPVGDTVTNLVLPIASLRANQSLIFDASGNVTVGAMAQAPISVAMQPVVAASTLSAARAAMGLGTGATTNVGTIATQNANAVALTGGTIDNTVIGGTTPAAASVTSMNSGQLAAFRNLIINGNFKIAQRGTTLTLATAGVYGIDRWMSQGPNGVSIANQDNSAGAMGLPGLANNVKLGRNSGSSVTTALILNQSLTSNNSSLLTGMTATLSYYAKAGANYSSSGNTLLINLYTGAGTDQSAQNGINGAWSSFAKPINLTDTLTTSWQRFTHTIALGTGWSQLGVLFAYTPTGTAGSDDNVYITGVQLEPGPVATPFENRLYEAEFALCQAYYEKSFPYSTAPAQAVGTGTGELICNAAGSGAIGNFFSSAFRVRKRAAPTMGLYNPHNSNAQAYDEQTGTDCSSTGTYQVGEENFSLSFVGPSGMSSGNPVGIHWSASAEL